MDSLLSIISSQRERFRARNQELEAVSYMLPSPTLLGPEDSGRHSGLGEKDVSQTINCSGIRFVLYIQGGLSGRGCAILGFERGIRHPRQRRLHEQRQGTSQKGVQVIPGLQ